SLLATASNDRSVRLLEARTGDRVASWSPGESVMQAVAFHPRGNELSFGGQEPVVWTGELGAAPAPERHAVPLPPAPGYGARHVTALAYTPDGEYLLIGTGDRILHSHNGYLHIWWTPLGEEECSIPVDGGVQSISVRLDGTRMALGTGAGWELGW